VTETRDDTVTWLTQEAYDRLKSELDYLSGPGRTEIAKRIEAARDEGDLRENGGYHAAKEEQGKQESAFSRSCTSWTIPGSATRRAPTVSWAPA